MLFPYDDFGPAFTALQQPQSQPTTMFNGVMPAFHAHPAPADPIPIVHSHTSFTHLDPIFTAGKVQPFNGFGGPMPASTGQRIDIRG